MEAKDPSISIDKWLWYARFFKTRTLSGKIVSSGAVRLDGERVAKASMAVKAGDVLTFPQEKEIKVIKILDTGFRHGPAPEAQALYEDISPPPVPRERSVLNPKYDLGGRPSRKERAEMDERFKN